MTATQLNELCKAEKKPFVLDVRTPAEFREFHCPQARNAPLADLDPKRWIAEVPAGEPIYLICRSGTRGQQAYEKFRAAGFENVVNIEGGTLAWAECNLPLNRGRKAMALERQVRIAAGSIVLLGLGLSFLSPWFLGISAFVGGGLVFSGLTDTCGMGMILSKMPWNR